MDSTPDQPVPPPEDPRDGPAPTNPYAGGHPVPAPGQPGRLGYAPGAWTPPVPARKGLSFGAGLGIGIAIGIVAHVLGVVAMFASAGAAGGAGGILVMLWPFLLIAVAAGVMMFFRATRSYATGTLIIAAAMWLVIIGPCIVLLGGFR